MQFSRTLRIQLSSDLGLITKFTLSTPSRLIHISKGSRLTCIKKTSARRLECSLVQRRLFFTEPIPRLIIGMAGIIAWAPLFRSLWQNTRSRMRRLIKRVAGSAGLLLVGGFGSYWLTHLEKTPVTNRVRFETIKLSQESLDAMEDLEARIKHLKEPPSNPACMVANRCLSKILACNSHLFAKHGAEDLDWEVILLKTNMINAHALVNGHVYIHTGLLRVIENEDQLAAVIGHEVAHALLRHQVEKQNQKDFHIKLVMFVDFLIISLVETWYIATPLFIAWEKFLSEVLYYSNFHEREYEADKVGLAITAKAGFNPEEILHVFNKVAKTGKDNSESWFSTHPTGKLRIEALKQSVSQANEIYKAASCNVHIEQVNPVEQARAQMKKEKIVADTFEGI